MADYILGIESSCDDTSAAVIRDGYLLSNVIASQQVHKDFGGVVPELASRAHEQNIVPVVSTALERAGIKPSDLTAIAFTRGPGLLGSLLVGTSFAKALGIALNIPIVMVNHLQGHLLANFIREEGKAVREPSFPRDTFSPVSSGRKAKKTVSRSSRTCACLCQGAIRRLSRSIALWISRFSARPSTTLSERPSTNARR